MDESTSGGELQFDKAEFDSGDEGLTCAHCQRPILDAYYEVNGQTTCVDCRSHVETLRTQGSPAGRVVKAAVLGSIGGLIGAGVYYAIAATTGYEFSLIAIGVGILVGVGVRMGSGGAGGRGYQFLAAALTYIAIVSTYLPLLVQEITQAGEEMTVQDGQEEQATSAEVTQAEDDTEVTTAMIVAYVFVLGFIAFAAPFLALFEGAGAVMGLIIIGIGVYQAWRINAYHPLEVEGPFELDARTSSAPAPTFGGVDV